MPYDGEHRALPAVWIDRTDATRLHALLDQGPVRGRIEVDARRGAGHTHNVIGTLPGPPEDDEWVVIGSHHDAPWASAVEDGTGIALVLAQARAWAAVPAEDRPHNLLFLLNGGHMTGGAGIWAFLERERELLDRTVLAVHLEHAAARVEVVDDRPVATGDPEAVWWFTARDPQLEATVAAALAAEQVERAWTPPARRLRRVPPDRRRPAPHRRRAGGRRALGARLPLRRGRHHRQGAPPQPHPVRPGRGPHRGRHRRPHRGRGPGRRRPTRSADPPDPPAPAPPSA